MKKMRSITNRQIVFVILFVLLFSFFVFQGRAFIFPPSIEIENPNNLDVETTSKSILIKGNVEGGSKFFINQEKVNLPPSGNFEFNFSLSEGRNIFNLKAKNTYGLSSSKKVEVIRVPL